MQQHTHAATAHASEHTEHVHHWEVSWAPMAISFGTMFLVPIAFISYFVYGSGFAAMVAAGIGVPLVLSGIARWVHEGVTQHAAISDVSPVGVGVFIIGEILIFLGLFASYWSMRLAAGSAWPPAGTPELNYVLPLVMTVILVASSMTYHRAEHLFEHGDMGGFRTWLIISVLLGGLFLGCTFYEYGHLAHENFLPSTNAYSAAFYSLTGFHASHVIVGLVTFLFVLFGSLRSGAHRNFVKVAGIYWHFVDVVWFFVASQVYFW